MPGFTAKMNPVPDHGDFYKEWSAGREEGHITGVTAESAGRGVGFCARRRGCSDFVSERG
jgi:hypothetical protein